jgi:hypothetical protein
LRAQANERKFPCMITAIIIFVVLLVVVLAIAGSRRGGMPD